MTHGDLSTSIDVAAGYLAARLAWLAIEQGILRPFATAFGREAYRRADAATGGRLPDLPTDHR